MDSYGFIAAATLGRDVIWRLRRDRAIAAPFYTRWAEIHGGFASALALANRA